MKFISLALFLLLFPGIIFSQSEYTIQVQMGKGSNSMKELKDFQYKTERQWSLVNLKRIDDFPSYYYYELQLLRSIKDKFSVGLDYRFQSTGYKSSYKDFSGELRFQQVLQVNQLGGVFTVPVTSKESKVTVSFPMKVYYSWTICNLDYEILLSGTTADSFKETFISKSIMVNPGIHVAYSIFKPIKLGLTAGYNFDFRGEMKLWSNRDAKLQSGGNTVVSNWSGYRIGVLLEYNF